MGRSPCCKDVDVKKGPWTPEEDKKLTEYIEKNNGAHGSWRRLPELAGLNRCGKSCRLRWTNYLRPDIKRGRFSEEEEQLIVRLHSVLGNKWSSIAAHLPGRTDNEIKNYWNTHVRRKLLRSGIDPVTHRQRTDVNLLGSLPNLLTAAGFAGHLADYSVLQLQAGAADLLRLQLLQSLLQALSRSETPSTDLTGLLGSPFPAIPAATEECLISSMLAILRSGLPPNTCTPPAAAVPEGCNSDELGAEISKGSSTTASFVLASTSAAAPSLVSASPEADSAHVAEPINSGNPSKCSPTSAAFVDWDQDLCLRDLADNDFCWKDIEEQISWFDGH